MSGKLSPALAEAILETLPLEMTVIDENDRIVWWNTRRERVFPRPEEVRGRDVRSCHNDESNHMIDRLLREMKAGERETARFWYNRIEEGLLQKLVVDYIAIRDAEGHYLGCIETLQDVAPFRFIEGERRRLDG